MDYQPQDPAPGAPDPNQAPYQPPQGGYTPPVGGPDPAAPTPPYQPPQPQGGYAPPAGSGYAPPADGGYAPPQGGAPPYQPAGGGYGGGYQAPPKKGGFNWLACCGIGCGVLILITILVCTLMWKVVAPFVGMGMEAGKVTEELGKTDLAAIKSQASPVDAAALAASPESYEGKWLDLTAVEETMPSSGNNYSGQKGTTYFTKEMIIITDISNGPQVGQPGDTIHAYGKIVIMDMGKVPFLKQALEEEAAKKPGEKMPSKLVMFMAKAVEDAGGSSAKPRMKGQPEADDEAAPADEDKDAPADDKDAPADEAESKDGAG